MLDAADGLIHMMCETESHIQTIDAEKNNPKPDIKDEDPLTKKIKEMLMENTGCHILDSGGSTGRAWQQNRKKDFNSEPVIDLDIWDNDVSVSFNIYHYLKAYLEITEESETLQEEFMVFAHLPENEDKYWVENMEDFMEKYGSRSGVTNTYNYDNILGQVLQYGIFEKDGDGFIILQIHNGMDVRGGYTKPYVFYLEEPDYFHIAQNDLDCYCDKCDNNWYSDDCGYHYYHGGGDAKKTKKNKTLDGGETEIVEYDYTELEWETDKDEEKVFHKDCGGEINFGVRECY